MDSFPFGYQPIEALTWTYLSSLLMLALFFKFNRFWSIRNFDLFLIILLAPGLLMVHYGELKQSQLVHNTEVGTRAIQDQMGGEELKSTEQGDAASAADRPAGPGKTSPGPESGGVAANGKGVPETGEPIAGKEDGDDESLVGASPLTPYQSMQRYGYIWLFSIGAVWLVRLFYDPMLIRKPMLEPNLTLGGLVFLTCSLTIFLFANVWTSRPANLDGPEGAVNLVHRNAEEAGDRLEKYGPGYPLLHIIPTIRTFTESERPASNVEEVQQLELVDIARIMAILSQLAIIFGLIYIGNRHFGSFQMGVGMAAIFLMLPYTAQFAGDSMHLLPGALLVWAVAAYRNPAVAGVLIGIAAGVCYYPLFLLPLWISFYWERGRTRFLVGALVAIALVVSSLSLTSADFGSFLAQLKSIFGFILPRQDGLGGIWSLNWESWFRLPLLVAFIILCVSYAFWPVVKDLASLISCTAAAMIAVQYWHGDGGGLYMAWYLPLVLLVIFRPNLDDKVAVAVLKEPRPKTDDASSSDLDFAASTVL